MGLFDSQVACLFRAIAEVDPYFEDVIVKDAKVIAEKRSFKVGEFDSSVLLETNIPRNCTTDFIFWTDYYKRQNLQQSTLLVSFSVTPGPKTMTSLMQLLKDTGLAIEQYRNEINHIIAGKGVEDIPESIPEWFEKKNHVCSNRKKDYGRIWSSM